MIKYFLGTLIAALLFISCNSSSSDAPLIILPPVKTTVMIYIPGTDLESNGQAGNTNIASMLQADSSDKLNIVLQTGASYINYETAPIPAGKTIFVKDWTKVKRHDIKDNKITERQTLGKSCFANKGETTDCIEMGTPAALTDFIRYSVKEYPADRYILILWDHGGGAVDGYGDIDVRAMNTNEIMAALAATVNDVKFDIIGFDACLMATAEYAYNLRHFGKYLVASEELEAGKGWDYKPIFSAIAKNPSISSLDIGKIIADSLVEYTKDTQMATLSVIDMSKTEAVVKELEDLSRKLVPLFRANPSEHWIKIFNSRASAEEFGMVTMAKEYTNEIDIIDFTKAMTYYDDELYGPAVAPLAQAAAKAVLYSKTGEAHTSATGLSLYFPFNFKGKPEAASLEKYNSIYHANKPATFSPVFKTLLTELISYAETTPSAFSLTLGPVIENRITTDVTSNFGIHYALLLANHTTAEGNYRYFVSDIATVFQQEPARYNLAAKSDGAILTLNGIPVYMELAGRSQTASPSDYDFKIPVYVKLTAEPDTTIDANLFMKYNFESNISTFILADPIGDSKRDDIELAKGDIIIIPDINIIDGEITKSPSATTITLTAEPNFGLAIRRTAPPFPYTNMMFQVLNLKGEQIQSQFFNIKSNTLKLY